MLTRKARSNSRDYLTSNPSQRPHCRISPGTTSGAVGTSTRADACALQAYTQLPAPSDHHLIHQFPALALRLVTNITIFLVHGAWHCRQSKDTQHKVHRHQQIHLRTCHCHWHKPTRQATSPLKFEPHMDRQCLIVCDPLTFVLDAPTFPY